MFGINKNGTKHKIGIIMPANYPSARVTYGNESVEDALDDAKIFYKDIDVSGTACSNYYATVSTGVLKADYQAIGFAELNPWDENVTYSIGGGTYNALYIRSRSSSYTISANKVVRVFFVKAGRITPLT